MGAWGLGPFENDDACDWLMELGAGGAAAIDGALNNLIEESEGELIETGTGACAVAAMEILARIKEGNSGDDELLEISGIDLASHRGSCNSQRRTQALKSAAIVKSENSELRQLWNDAEQVEEWEATIDAIVSRLKG